MPKPVVGEKKSVGVGASSRKAGAVVTRRTTPYALDRRRSDPRLAVSSVKAGGKAPWLPAGNKMIPLLWWTSREDKSAVSGSECAALP